MKNRILTFIIGVLIGAIIAITAFLIYSKVINKNLGQYEKKPMNENGQMIRPGGEMENPPEKPEGDFQGQNGKGYYMENQL